MDSSVKLLKLVSGEEILATVEQDFNGNGPAYKITDAILVIPQQGPPDATGKTQIMFAFIPWGTLAKESIVIDENKIIYITDPEDQILNHYGKITGKVKIEVPPKNLVIAR